MGHPCRDGRWRPTGLVGGMIHFHPDRDGCDCDRRSLTNDDECLHADPCWISREAYAEAEHTAKQVPGLVALFDEATKELVSVEDALDRLITVAAQYLDTGRGDLDGAIELARRTRTGGVHEMQTEGEAS